MLQTMNRQQFIDAFRQNDERRNEYSYEALDALYTYLDEFEYRNEYLFDLVAICCDWTEYATLEEAVNDYSYATPEELEYKTVVIPCKSGYLVQNH